MVDLSVKLADARGELWVASAEASPDFGADAAAHAFVIIIIVVGARGRWMDASAEVALHVGVFPWIIGDVFDERLGKIVGIQFQTIFFNEIQPEDLQFDVVVRQADFPKRRVEFVVEKLLAAFEWRSNGAANAFSKPASVDAVAIFGEFHGSDELV